MFSEIFSSILQLNIMILLVIFDSWMLWTEFISIQRTGCDNMQAGGKLVRVVVVVAYALIQRGCLIDMAVGIRSTVVVAI